MTEESKAGHEKDGVEMPQPTAWPLVLAVGVTLLMAGVGTHLALSAVGAVLLIFGLVGWFGCLMPGRGHGHEPRAAPELRPGPVSAKPGTVQHLAPGMPGYRFRLPLAVHPISAGIKGGIVGGIVMVVPALAYGFQSGNGPWFPINLLAGMVLPGVDDAGVEQLKQFHLTWLIVASVIHLVISLSFGTLYGVLLPTLPSIPGGQLLWGGLLMPLLWTGASYGFMGILNPTLQQHVDWPWFIVSQFVFGVAAAVVVIRTQQVYIPAASPAADQRSPHAAE